MTPLRQRMIEDMQVRNLARHTQRAYLQQISLFARHFGKSPDILGPADIRAYQLHLSQEKRLSASSILVAVAAIRFLYKITLGRGWSVDEIIPTCRKPQKLPAVLSQDEVARFLDAVDSRKHRAILTICYAAGLRISEAVRLTPAAIDSHRMVICVEEGKGRKDRCVMLSPRLLEVLRTYWRAVHPKNLLFPGDIPDQPISTFAVQHACKKARRRAGIAKPVTPCISHLPAGARPARLRTQACPSPLRVSEPACELGAACFDCPHARTVARAGRARICKEGSWTISPRDSLRRYRCVKGSARCARSPVGPGLCRRARRQRPGQSRRTPRGARRVADCARSHRWLRTTVAAALASAGLPLAVVNPRQIRSFAKALGKLAKTDAIDAEVIALFADKVRPQIRPVPTSDARALGELVARRRQVVEMIGMEANRRRHATDKRLAKTIDRHVAFLEKESPPSTLTSTPMFAPRPHGAKRKTCSLPSPASAR